VESADEGVAQPTKREKRRVVRIDEATAEVLARHIEEYPSPDGYVFTSPEGQDGSAPELPRRPLRPAREKVRHLMLPGFSCYDTRHTHTPACWPSRGWRSEQVAERLGHDSVRTTLDGIRTCSMLSDLAGMVREASAPFCPHPEVRSLRWVADRASDLRLLERTTGFEPATPTLARWCSTTEPRPQTAPSS
jgi:hypothetical protein